MSQRRGSFWHVQTREGGCAQRQVALGRGRGARSCCVSQPRLCSGISAACPSVGTAPTRATAVPGGQPRLWALIAGCQDSDLAALSARHRASKSWLQLGILRERGMKSLDSWQPRRQSSAAGCYLRNAIKHLALGPLHTRVPSLNPSLRCARANGLIVKWPANAVSHQVIIFLIILPFECSCRRESCPQLRALAGAADAWGRACAAWRAPGARRLLLLLRAPS